MRHRLLLTTAAALAACQAAPETDIDNGTASNVAADNEAGPIAPVAATPAPTASATPADRAANAEDSAPMMNDDDAQGAADVVRSYYALIAARHYDQAYALWRPGSAGMDKAAFARGFAPYATYRATTGAPGPVDAGAGQRYVTVPVTVQATRKGGAAFALAGSVVLHKTADIDGATAADRAWHIQSIDLKPAPAGGSAAPPDAATMLPPVVSATYSCEGGFRFVARFDNQAETVALRRDGTRFAILDQQRAASGIWYRGQGYELRGKGREGTLTRPDGTALSCTSD